MKNVFYFFATIFFIACNTPATNNSTEEKKDSVIINVDTISEVRTNISKKPVASYYEKINDELNDWAFDIKVYETRQTFYFLMKVKYEEMDGIDTLKIPNIGIHPTIEIRKTNEKYTCIVGFYDKQKEFKEYKKVSFKNGALQIKTIGHYGVYNVLK
jgi:hypothetical protein